MTLKVLLIVYTGVTIEATYHGLGHRKGDVPNDELSQMWSYIFAQPALLTFMIFMSKTAFVAFLLQLVVEKT